MRLTFNSLPAAESPLSRLDPRWLMVASIFAAVVIAFLHTVPAAMAALAGALLMAVIGRVPLRWYFSRLGAAAVFLVLVSLLLPLSVALVVCLKALAIMSLMLALIASSPLPVMLKAAHALHVPGLFLQLATLTYRYTFVLAAELARLRVALRVRGYRNRFSRHCYKTVGHVAGTLLVRGYERAERVGQAMRCRGFDGRFRALTEFQTRPADVGFFLVMISAALGLVLWEVLPQ